MQKICKYCSPTKVHFCWVLNTADNHVNMLSLAPLTLSTALYPSMPLNTTAWKGPQLFVIHCPPGICQLRQARNPHCCAAINTSCNTFRRSTQAHPTLEDSKCRRYIVKQSFSHDECSRHTGRVSQKPCQVVRVSGMLPISLPSTGAWVSGKFSQPGKLSTVPSLLTCTVGIVLSKSISMSWPCVPLANINSLLQCSISQNLAALPPEHHFQDPIPTGLAT